MSGYRLWVNEDRTMLIRFWDNGMVEVCTRPETEAIWGPPIRMNEERA